MKLSFDIKLTKNYTSNSQKARVLTEGWVANSVFCPSCGNADLSQYGNSRPVADFCCKNCDEDYELKSKKSNISNKIVDGAYGAMIERLGSSNNPNFFLLNYNAANLSVTDFLVIPKHYFVPSIIERRKPLALSARRAGWIGCNILLDHIPQTGKIFLVRNRHVEPKSKILAEWKKTLFLREEKELSAKGWLLDTMRCVEKLGRRDFSLDDVYAFEKELSMLHPDNKHIKDKIRQQLQILRDSGYLKFVSRGRYELT